MADLKHLFQPIRIGKLNLSNRIILLPMALGYADGGRPTPRLIKFLQERARGGCGAVCTPFSIFPAGDTFFGYMGLDASNDAYIDSARQLADAMHGCDVPVIGQLNTLTVWRRDRNSELEIVGPSPFAARPKGHVPRELTIEEINVYVMQHGAAARRLREAGYDAVEVMGGIGNIISRFTSPLANQRRDEYGGNFENRMRLPIEIIREIRKEAGDDFPLLWRYSGHEFLDGGYDIEGAVRIGQVLKGERVEWLNIQVGWHDSPIPLITKEVPQGGFAYISEAIRKALNLPVVTSYRITDPIMADEIIASGKADLIGLARALISDPEWAIKAREGRFKDINRCICCCRCVDQTVGAGKGLELCSVNPRIGNEIDTEISPAEKIKKVFIVGSGPAGMEAARVSRLRGHEVILFERQKNLGGQLIIARLPPDKYEIGYIQDYLENQVRNLDITIKINHEVTEEYINRNKPDCVVLAVGASPAIPNIPGIFNKNVCTAVEILEGRQVIGHKIVVIGGGLIGCEVALFLVDQGRDVTILEMLPKIGMDIGASERFITITKLKEKGVHLNTGVTVTGINEEAVIGTRASETLTFVADQVVVAAGMKKNNAINNTIGEVYAIGDCVEPSRIGEAVKEGYKIGLRI